MKKLSDRHICFIAGCLGQGGAERQLYYMLRALKASGATAHVLSLTSGEFWEARIQGLGVDVVYVGRSGNRLTRLQTIAQVLRRIRPDFVQSQHFFANLYATLAGRMTGVPDIGAIRCDAANEVLNGGPVFGRLNLLLPRTMVANSRAAMTNAMRQKRPPNHLHYLANVVDTEEFLPGDGAGGAALRIVAAGRLIRRKRHELLLRAVARLRRRGVPAEVTIAGAGPLETELRTLGAELGYGSALHMPGTLDTAAIASLYRNTDIFVLPSDYEGTPNVVLEAMSAGLPVIATRASGVPEIVDHDVNGVMIEPGNLEELTSAIAALAADISRRRALGAAARRHILARYSVHSLPTALEGIYNAALV